MKKVFTLFMTVITLSAFLAGCGSSSGNEASKISGMQLTEIINTIYEKKQPELSLVTDNMDMTDAAMFEYNTGLASTDKIKEAAISEPMIGSQAYSLVMVRCKNAGDAKDVAQEMKNNIDQRKWVCVEADDLKVVAKDDVVMLFMVSSEFADTVTANDIVNAFKEIAGTVDLEL